MKWGSVTERFWNRVDKLADKSCWLWLGPKTPTGYGRMRAFGQDTYAHRVSWVLYNGNIPKNLSVLHYCDNTSCVNPKHLWIGTQDDNLKDMVKKGRSYKGPRHWVYASPEKHARGEKHWWAKLNKSQIVKIRKRYRKGGITQKQLAAEYHVAPSTIGAIVNHVNWK